MPIFHVATASERYPVVVERGVLTRWRDYVPAGSGQSFVISEERIWQAQGARLDAKAARVFFLPGGEQSKRLAHLEAAAEWLLEQGADRASVVIAFGGGIVGDMAGFLAATFMRGIPVIQIPTTLLAQVDASIGGKTGVNLRCGKNLLGSFHQPAAVLIDPSVLETLPDREFRAGLFEVIKAGVIRSPDLFRFLQDYPSRILARAPDAVDRVIAESVQIKAEVVSADERESGLRRILNFGHTIGHAIEAETGYQRFLHGEAVALGMKGAVKLAVLAGRLAAPTGAAIEQAIAHYGPVPLGAGISLERVIERLRGDKKTRHGDVHFVLPVRIGAAEVVSGIPAELIRAAVETALA